MKRAAFYSSPRRRPAPHGDAPDAPPAAPAASPTSDADGIHARARSLAARHPLALLALSLAVVCGLLVGLALALQPTQPALTQEMIDEAVLHTLENKTLPSRAAKAAEIVRPSVVRVRGFNDDGKGEEKQRGVGSGVVIVDKGVILTNLHVVAGAKRVSVTFADGMESDAELLGLRPENDLAVIRAKTIPDDLVAATLGSTNGLRPGDDVVAVGFPFGIGPSVSAGVVSGLNREFRSPEGERLLTGLIQFDAAANPGNSGGPLISMDGEVLGIVTAILNPSEARTFIGIGFAVTIESAGSAVGIPPF
jgi:S1-C subfamily serine protease